jgi:hypothetical protein
MISILLLFCWLSFVNIWPIPNIKNANTTSRTLYPLFFLSQAQSEKYCPEAEFLDKIQIKVFRVFLLAIQSRPTANLEIWIYFFPTHATSYSFDSSVTLLYTVKEKGGKPDRKPYPLLYSLRNPYRNLSAELSRLCWNCTFMNSTSGGFTEECGKASPFFYLRTTLSYRTVKPRCRSKVHTTFNTRQHKSKMYGVNYIYVGICSCKMTQREKLFNVLDNLIYFLYIGWQIYIA